MHRSEGRKFFFSEEKKQKTFAFQGRVRSPLGTYLTSQKFFGSFLQKRTASFGLSLTRQRPAALHCGSSVEGTPLRVPPLSGPMLQACG
jgi:hypothetical protein